MQHTSCCLWCAACEHPYTTINHPARKLNYLFNSEILSKKFTSDGLKNSAVKEKFSSML